MEKFIGDAVMAVWGTPTAQEDDAERAVRAALDLAAAVPQLDPSLKARAGVLSGEAAVTLGATGEGMVAGDLVNTASRIQAAAEPSNVLAGEATKRATEAAIAYEDAGLHELKGKAEPVPLFRALRVTAGRAGALKSTGLEPPFVGRDRELRVVKELFHASAEEGKAHLVSVVGIAGIGKSRLAWEFFKYLDGLADARWWQRGRCLAYGEGVAYWALAEMVRTRAEIAEGEELSSARAKLRGTIEEHLADPDERAWIEPRLAHLLGLEERATGDRDDLFPAWRLFFERLAETRPTVLVFEDMQWADVSLLEFVEYLLEWSRNHPIFVLALARPELHERHPSFGAASRNATTLSLEPLSPAAMEELLIGFVPGLSDELRAQILERSEGVPLYAVETVRMLLDRGLLAREGSAYRPGPIEALDVPETLHALIAARLDGLASDERRLLQTASVLGKTFTKPAVAAVSGLAEPELEPLLVSLVRKEVLSIQADPRSPERGQYGFLQDLVKRVAYETLAKSERKALHLAAAGYLERAFAAAEPEIVEVLASHYLDAYGAGPEAEDAPEIKARAREMLARAGERAASLAANEEAQRYFEQAAGLADESLDQATLLEHAGETAWAAGRGERAQELYERAIALFEAEGQPHLAARVSPGLGEVDWAAGRLEQSIERMERSFGILSRDEADADLAALASMVGRLHWFMGDPDLAAERTERALEIAEALWLPDVLSQSLNTKGGLILAMSKARPEEGFALLGRALEIALEHDVQPAALRAYYNLGNLACSRDRHDAAATYLRDGLALARRIGDRQWEWAFLAGIAAPLYYTGRWNEALERAAEIPGPEEFGVATRPTAVELLLAVPQINVARGRLDEARRALEPFAEFAGSADLQERASYQAATASVLRAEGASAEALEAARAALDVRADLGAMHACFKLGFLEAAEAASALGDLDGVRDLVATGKALRAGESTPFLHAQVLRFGARLAAAGEGETADDGFKSAVALFRETGLPFWLAVTQLEHGEWLLAQGRAADAEPLLAEAREVFDRLEASPWLERAGQLAVGVAG